LDKITVVAFRLFPKKFHLIGFPEYPDGLTIYTCLWLHNTKTKRWLTGSVQSGFKITEKGRHFLEETKKMLDGEIKVTKVHGTVPKRKEVTFINLLKKTTAYKKYSQNKKEDISDSEILEVLKVPLSGSKEIRQKHLKRYLEYAKIINDQYAMEFLEFIQKNLKGDKNDST